ncbi:MAG TPA: gliding motility-associated C-terminal domain-containing protein [Lutibacter sp.]|nr:gliding motility-associated C-terminal domain-containing protein [Lutibacter sp.]
MEKEKFLLPKKISFLIFFILSLSYNSTFSQCINPIPIGNASQVFCKSDNSTIANLVASGDTIVWYDLPSGGEMYGTTEVLVNGITYYADNISGNSCSISRLAVTVTIYGDFPTNVDVSVGKCAIDNPTVSSLSAIGENIEWYDAQTGGNLLSDSHLLESGKTYWVQQTENGCTSARFPTMVILIDPLTPTTAPIQSFCSPPNATIANLRASGTTILWYDSETSTTPLKTTTPLINGEDYWVAEVTFPCVSSNRAKTTVVIDMAPDAGESSSLTECEVNFVTTNLFDLLGGTPDTTGIWTGPSTLSNGYLGTFEPGINTIGTYTYTVSSALGICPADSATISMIITVVPPPTTANIVQAFCEIKKATIADLSTNQSNVFWYDTETSTTALNSAEALVDGEDYWGALPDPTSGCLSAIRLKITANITVIPPPITANVNQVFCEIDNPTVQNLNAIGGTIHWYSSETSTTRLDPSEALINGATYWASQTETTSGCESLTRLAVNVLIISPLPPTTSEHNQIFCEIDIPKIQNLNASGTGILWYATETSITPLNQTDLLVNGTSYWATQTVASGCESANRLVVTVTIIAPTPPTTTQVNQTFCEIDNPKVANLSASGTGILWYASETSTSALNPTDLLVNGASYWATQTDATSNCESKNRLVVNVSISAPLPPTTSAQNQNFCAINNPTIANLSASGTGIRWYASETSTVALNPTDLLANGATYWASQTAASGCESASRLIVNVTIITPQPPITITQSKTFCEIEKATVTNLSDPGNVLLWYATETSTTPLNATDLLVDGSIYWATQTISAADCEIANRLKVTVSITKILPPTTTQASQIFCEIENAKIGDLSASGAGILWYDTAISTTPLNVTNLLVNGKTYWATQTNATSGCESASRLVVTVVINTTPPPTTALANQSFCIKDYLPNAPTIANLSASGSGILWYATATSTTPLNTATALLDGTAYYATQTNATNGCESASRLVVNVSIINPATPTTTSVNQAFCAADKATIASLQVSGTSIIWYANETAATPLNSTDLLINSEDYWAAASNASTGCESIVRLKVTVSVTDVAPATIVNISQTFCESDTPTIANLAATGNGILWYATQASASPLANSTPLVNGVAYWAAQSNATTGCISSVRVVVNVTLSAIKTPTLISLGNEFCKIDNPTIADLNLNVSVNNGGAISWYDAFPNGNLLNASALLIDGETYYAIETTVNGCKSSNPLEVTVTLEACDEYDVEIYDGFSPTGNGTNDTFKIKNLRELYPDFKVEFFNRWGNLIYTANAENGDWNGRLNGDGELSPAGVYFFIVYFNKENRKPIQRRLYLSR